MKKDIIIYEESFFSKIRRFFLGLFKKKNTKDIKDNFQNQSNTEKNDFMKKIEIKPDEDELKIKNLQKKYKLGEIKEEDMTDEEHAKLIELYKKQNEDIIKIIENKKNSIKKKIEDLNQQAKSDFRRNVREPQTNTVSLKYKLKNGEIAISDLSNSELDDIINYYEESTKKKMKKLQIKNAG